MGALQFTTIRPTCDKQADGVFTTRSNCTTNLSRVKFYDEGACFEYFAGGRVTSIYNCFCFTRLFENKNSVVYSTANL